MLTPVPSTTTTRRSLHQRLRPCCWRSLDRPASTPGAPSESPSYRAAQQRFVQTYPKAKVFLSDPSYPINSIQAAELAAGEAARHYYSLEQAGVIVAVDSDFLGVEQDHALSPRGERHRQVHREVGLAHS